METFRMMFNKEITKTVTFWIQAKPVPTHDPYRWPGLGGVVFYGGFNLIPNNTDDTLPALVWDRGEWRTYKGNKDVE